MISSAADGVANTTVAAVAIWACILQYIYRYA